MGHINMTIETVADMVWALDCDIAVKITDMKDVHRNHPIEEPPKLAEQPKIPEIRLHDAKPSSGSVDLKKPYEIALP